MFIIGDAISNTFDSAVDALRRGAANLGSGSARFRVEPDKVYELANRFDAVADKIQIGLWREVMLLAPDSPGADRPSRDAVGRLTETGFGDAGLVSRLIAYSDEMHEAAAALRATAKQYGLTDNTEGGRLSAANL
jgi:hypothetical protein